VNTYLIRFDSESGDHFTVGLYSSENYPTNEQLDTLARQKVSSYIVCVEEGEKEPTLYGSFNVESVGGVVEPLPEPDGLPPLAHL
jgi:hypothetical protein